MADGLLAQSAIDRLQSAAYELVLDGESYRHRQRPAPTATSDGPVVARWWLVVAGVLDRAAEPPVIIAAPR